MAKQSELENRFVELRAQRRTLKEIAEQLGIDAVDAMQWNDRLSDRVARYRTGADRKVFCFNGFGTRAGSS